MNDLNGDDLCLLGAALRAFMHNSDKSIAFYVDENDAAMLLVCAKEKKAAHELLTRVLAAEDDFYVEGSLQEWE
jgi:hypothetical protein